MFLPCEDNVLRFDVMERHVLPDVQCDVEHVAYRIIKSEIVLFRYLYAIKNKLFKMQNFNLMDAFKMIDVNNTGGINDFKIYTFLRDNDYIATQEDLNAIIRRIDLNGDEIIGYEEFK